MQILQGYGGFSSLGSGGWLQVGEDGKKDFEKKKSWKIGGID